MSRQIMATNIPDPIREYRFGAHAVGWLDDKKPPIQLKRLLRDAGLRDWRFDFAWPELRIALEIEGAPGRGRHTNVAGFTEDCHKYNAAALLGWTVYRVTGRMVHDGTAIRLLGRALKGG